MAMALEGVMRRPETADTNTNSQTPISVRVSMEDYYQQRGGSLDFLDEPPSYDAFLLQPTNSRKYNIQPREDEGRETLPPYSCAISLEAVFMRKLELEGAVHRAQDRNWYRVFATLQGTALSFHKYKGPGPFQIPLTGSSPDMPAGARRGVLMKSYNLQHADVGIAADYFKKRYVIRVRAEADQFLLSCLKIETFVLWLQSLFAAIDLAPPLDDRQIPRDLSIPRPRRRRAPRTAITTNLNRGAALVAQQEEILRTQYPRLADAPTIPEDEDEAEAGEDEEEDEDADIPSEENTPPVRPSPTPIPSTSNSISTSTSTSTSTSSTSSSSTPRNGIANTTALISRTRAQRALNNSLNSSSHPSISSTTGKWQPHHQWTPLYDMQYAKRCMAVLTSRSPRKSNFVIVKGKQWIVDWATGALTRWEPPEYGDVVKETERERKEKGLRGSALERPQLPVSSNLIMLA